MTHVRRLLFLSTVVASAAAASLAGTARAAADVSSNWSGYAVSGQTFSSVSGSWTQPAATCTSGSSSAAFWVGLGGNSVASQALDSLRDKGLARHVSSYDSRVPKYAHQLAEVFNFDRREIAVLCVLLLRGPQTPGELRGRTDRLYGFDDLTAVEATLKHLSEREPPLNRRSWASRSTNRRRPPRRTPRCATRGRSARTPIRSRSPRPP